jgi:hypothetical protein
VQARLVVLGLLVGANEMGVWLEHRGGRRLSAFHYNMHNIRIYYIRPIAIAVYMVNDNTGNQVMAEGWLGHCIFQSSIKQSLHTGVGVRPGAGFGIRTNRGMAFPFSRRSHCMQDVKTDSALVWRNTTYHSTPPTRHLFAIPAVFHPDDFPIFVEFESHKRLDDLMGELAG